MGNDDVLQPQERLLIKLVQFESLVTDEVASEQESSYALETLARVLAAQGRRSEAAARLRDPAVRIVTLTGPGGAGKSRLAMAAATEVASVAAAVSEKKQPSSFAAAQHAL